VPSPVLAAAVKAQNLPAFTRAIAAHKGPLPPKVIMNVAQYAWMSALKLLAKRGADFNASARNYRPLHAVIQEKPHGGAGAAPDRVVCLEWLLDHGADPELMGGWPQGRALVIAAFQGEPAYVRVLKKAGPKVDIFTAAALGDAKRVAALLDKHPSLAKARDGGLLTALQCAAGSRLGRKDAKIAKALLDIAIRLIGAGADVSATTKSWAHDVAVSYFAIGSRQVEILKLLLKHGLDPTTAIATAAWEKQEAMLDLLIASGGRIDDARDGKKPILNELVRWGQFTQARMLLARGASPNIPDERGWTAVDQAVSRGNARMLADLKEAGGKIGVNPRTVVS
jgi:ankyrin repeat protein